MSKKIELTISPETKLQFPHRCVYCVKLTENTLSMKIQANDDLIYRGNAPQYPLEFQMPLCEKHAALSEALKGRMRIILLASIFACLIVSSVILSFGFRNPSVAIMISLMLSAPLGVIIMLLVKAILGAGNPLYKDVPAFPGDWVLGFDSTTPVINKLILSFTNPEVAAEFESLNAPKPAQEPDIK
jgi:uncharacterized integral membrane protein